MMINRQHQEVPVCVNVDGLSNEDILEKFPVELRHFITELWLDGKSGIYGGNIQITNLYNFQKDDEDELFYAESFTLSIPFAGHNLIWEIMFNHRDLLFAPDIIFDDDTFLSSPELLNTLKTNLPAWGQWNPYNPKSLVTLVKECLSLFKQHQINILNQNEKYSRFSFEYSSLINETGVSAEEVEVLVSHSDIYFLISIPVDFSSLPPYIYESDVYIQNPGLDAAVLLVTFYRLDGSKIQPHLRLSPHVEQVLGGTGNKYIPSFPPHGCLMDYVPEVRKMLADRVESIVLNHKMKNEYVSQVLARNGCNIIEYDCITFNKITLLFEEKNFYWLLVITLNNNFPHEKPKYTLRSVYHMTCGTQNKPYMETLVDYPYSPRWSCIEMVQRALTYTFDNILSFQNSSVSKSVNI